MIGATSQSCLEMSWPIQVLLSTAQNGSKGEDSQIITKKWWEGEEGETCVKGLARLAKGYGGTQMSVEAYTIHIRILPLGPQSTR